MSDYHDCEVIARTEDSLVVRVQLVHPDARLPQPADRATLLRLLCEGQRHGIPTLLADPTFYDDDAVRRAAPAAIERGELVEVRGLFGARPTATYRIVLTPPTRQLLAAVRVGAGWGAAADIPGTTAQPPSMSLSQLMKARTSLEYAAKKPAGSEAERIATLQQLLVAARHPRDTSGPELRTSHVAALLGAYGEAASSATEALCCVVDHDAAVPLALGRIGDPTAIGTLVLALRSPHVTTRVHAMVALGWFGSAARTIAEPTLRAMKSEPRPVQTGEAAFGEPLALAFAHWRVLGDEQARTDMLIYRKSRAILFADALLREILFEGPCTALAQILDATRGDLAKLPSMAFARHEKAALHRCAARISSMPEQTTSATKTTTRKTATKKTATTKTTVTKKTTA